MSIAVSSAYVMAQNVSGITPPPYPIYWWNSPDVCPVRSVNNYLPWVFLPSGSQASVAQIDNSNSNYDGGDIGCNALEITDLLPWGYNSEDHDGAWHWMRNFIPLYDAQEQESQRYRIILEFGIGYLEPYVDANNPGYYWTTSQMRLTDRVQQENVLSQFVDAEGVFKASGNHIYMFAGADTFYMNDSWEGVQPTGLKHNIIYSGNILDACHNQGYPRVKWAGVVFDLQWIEQNLGVHLNPDWMS